MAKYLAFDPGVSTGWAAFDEKGDVVEKGIIRGLSDLIEWLDDREDIPEVVICESYAVFQKKAMAHTGSKLETSQAIGMIKAKALGKWKAEYVEQPSSILSIAVLWSGVKLPGNHDKSHDIAAYNHGVYYLQKNGIRQSRIITEGGR